MNCPVCISVSLMMFDRSGIEIDYCPQCRGVWLDRGELDKIIERATAMAPGQSATNRNPVTNDKSYSQPERRSYGHDHSRHEGSDYKKKKREGFWGELFDFD